MPRIGKNIKGRLLRPSNWIARKKWYLVRRDSSRIRSGKLELRTSIIIIEVCKSIDLSTKWEMIFFLFLFLHSFVNSLKKWAKAHICRWKKCCLPCWTCDFSQNPSPRSAGSCTFSTVRDLANVLHKWFTHRKSSCSFCAPDKSFVGNNQFKFNSCHSSLLLSN